MWDGIAFGHAIQAARKAQGLTQEQLGERVGVSAQAVSKWENGESCPEVALLPEVCAALEVSADALLGTARHQGFDALRRALGERLRGLLSSDRARQLSVAVAGLLLGGDERAGEWVGDQDFVSVGWARDGRNPLRAATLLTEHGSILHVCGEDLAAEPGVPEDEVVEGLRLIADPLVVRVLRRLLREARWGVALRDDARGDAEIRRVCDRLVEGGHLEQRRGGYGLTATGAVLAGAVLLLAEVPGLTGESHRVRWLHTWVG